MNNGTKTTTTKQKLLFLGILVILSIGIWGAVGRLSAEKKNGVFSRLAKTADLETKTNLPQSPPLQVARQLSKEYVYAGSRMLATEDYGIAQPNPTPTP